MGTSGEKLGRWGLLLRGYGDTGFFPSLSLLHSDHKVSSSSTKCSCRGVLCHHSPKASGSRDHGLKPFLFKSGFPQVFCYSGRKLANKKLGALVAWNKGGSEGEEPDRPISIMESWKKTWPLISSEGRQREREREASRSTPEFQIQAGEQGEA